MKKALNDLEIIMKAFRRSRSLKYEKKYNRARDASLNNEFLEKIHSIIENALSEEDKHYLNEYTDCVIALYNTDADYFYDAGFTDCQQFYARLRRAIRA